MSIVDGLVHIALIGEGHFSIVKWYRDQKTGEDYAVKDLKSEHLQDNNYIHWFQREVRILDDLKGHENIVESLGHEFEKDKCRYVMKKADTNLYQYIQENNANLEMSDRVRIFDQVLEAIRYAHSEDVLHRDIAPQNVLLFTECGKQIVKVSDFGIAKDLLTTTANTRSSAALYGRQWYASPEQLSNLNSATKSSDIFSLGQLLSFVCTGKEPSRPRQCPFSMVIKKATEEVPQDRYQTIEEFIAAYERVKEVYFVPPASGGPDFIEEYIEMVQRGT